MSKKKKRGSSSSVKAQNVNPMSWKRKTVWFFNKLLIGVTLLAYASAWVSPDFFWPAAFIAYGIPICFIGHLLFMYIWMRKQPLQMAYSLLTLAIGYPFIAGTLAINLNFSKAEDFSVLSYNTRVFKVYEEIQGKIDASKSQEMIDWVLNDDSAVKCFQEFYSISKGVREPIFNTVRQAEERGLYVYRSSYQEDKYGQIFGIATFSKYPIKDKGRIKFPDNSHNSGIFTDIEFPKGVVRVINVHLESVRITEEELTDTENIEEHSKGVFKKLKKSFIKRSQQLEATLKCIEDSPYPVILCGDLNDLPYSYTYLRLKNALNSGFEDAANGLGFSYNGLLFFLRIDNQFYSDELESVSYRTLRDIEHSDHYPIKASYKFIKK